MFPPSLISLLFVSRLLPVPDLSISLFISQEWQRELADSHKSGKGPSLLRTFRRIELWPFFFSGLLYTIYAASLLSGALLVKQFVRYAERRDNNETDSDWEGYRISLLFFAAVVIGPVSQVHCLYMTINMLLRMRAALVGVLFRKALKMSPAEKRNASGGAIVNLMASDSQRMLDFPIGFHMAWNSPILIILGVYLMYNEVGWAAFVGMATMLLFLPSAGYFTKKQMMYQRQAAQKTDYRVNIINEVIQGIRVVKYYAWEKPFLKVISDAREEELKIIRKFIVVKAVNFALLLFVPLLVSTATFVTFAANGGEMTAERVFTTIALIYVIRFPFTLLPLAINAWAQLIISFGRITKFLILEDVDESQIRMIPDEEENAVEVENADFSWKDEQLVLKDVDFKVKKGELVAVVGPVASGKSTLVSSILGECHINKGSVSRSKRVAYVPQSPFIVNATVRDNILFGMPYHEERYKRVIRRCQLKTDLDILPAGDMTEIGERGINISGGQKQRISCARAAYMEAPDLVLLDDPLSAVDAHVGKNLFDQCFNSLMKKSARILITHQMQYLPKCDRIIILKQDEQGVSSIVQEGTYEELLSEGLDFTALIETYNRGAEAQNVDKADDATVSEAKMDNEKEPSYVTPSVSSQNRKTPVAAGDGEKVVVVPSSSLEKDKRNGQAAGSTLVEKEELERGVINADVYKAYFLTAVGKPYLIFSIAVFASVQALLSLSDFWLSYWADNSESHSTGYYLGIYFALVMGSNSTLLGRSLLAAFAGLKSARMLHSNLFKSLIQKNMRFYDTTPVGRILNRISKDMYEIDMNLSQNVEHTTATILGVIGILVTIAVITPMILVLLFFLSYFYYWVQAYFRRSSREMQRLESVSRTPIFTHFSETLDGLSVIRALHSQDLYVEVNMTRTDANTDNMHLQRAANMWLRMRLDFISALVVLSTSALIVASYKWGIEIRPGLAGLAVTYSLNVTQMLNWSVMLSTALEAKMNSVERFVHYSKEEDFENWEAKNDRLSLFVEQTQWPSKGEIHVEDLEVSYAPELPPVLKKVSFDVPAGSRVGLVGRTGSGKSSFLNTLFRIIEPSNGYISIDGVDISEISLEQLRSNISIIPQDPVLFCGTLRYNLDPFGECSDARLWEALQHVQLAEAVGRFPSKLDEPITEGGDNLSVGQRQLLCLARALLRDSMVICLDEATANVDIETDELIQEVVRKNFAGRTILTIAHRLNTIMDYDLVLVLDQGLLAEFDSPANLAVKENGIFASMLKQGAKAH